MPDWIPEPFVGFCYDKSGRIWVIALTPTGPTLNLYSVDGTLHSSRPVDLSFPTLNVEQPYLAHLHMTVQQTGVFMAMDNCVIWDRNGEDSKLIELDSPITGIAPSPPYLRRRITTTCHNGCTVVWGDLDQAHVHQFARQFVNPKATYTREGLLAVACCGEGIVYASSDGRVTPKFSFDAPDAAVAGVVRTGQSRQFAVITEEGEVSVYDIPRYDYSGR